MRRFNRSKSTDGSQMYLITAQLVELFQFESGVDFTAEDRNGVQYSHRTGGEGITTKFHILSPRSQYYSKARKKHTDYLVKV